MHAIQFGETSDPAKPGNGFAGKLCGSAARIAGLLTVLSGFDTEIVLKEMEGAIRIARYFAEQAVYLMGQPGSTSGTARHIENAASHF